MFTVFKNKEQEKKIVSYLQKFDKSVNLPYLYVIRHPNLFLNSVIPC